jgi:pyruvate dehydrogenase E2 component (dihydrolipoyllysine-residue acetyltransferase)
MPSFSMYTVEGTVTQWLKPSGVNVAAGEPVLEIETEKALAEVVAPAAGILFHVAQPGEVVQVEALLGYVLAPGEAAPARQRASRENAAPPLQGPPAAARPAVGATFASPNARRIAAELGVDLAGVTGTGPDGRITEADVRAACEGTE